VQQNPDAIPDDLVEVIEVWGHLSSEVKAEILANGPSDGSHVRCTSRVRPNRPVVKAKTPAFLDNRLHVICYALIEGGIRVISFRKANKREQKAYEAQTADR
jgi:hypothetical protein